MRLAGLLALGVALGVALSAGTAAAGDAVAQGTAAPAASAQPAEPASAAPAATVSVGGSVPPASDVPASASAVPGAKPAPRPFAGASLYNQNSMTTGTVFRGQQQAYNPTVESNLWVLPRYAINEAWQLRGRVILTYEYTNNDVTTYRNEPMLSDTTLQLFYRKIPKFAGIQPFVALNAGFPTSKVSRARTLLFNPGASLQLARPFEHVLGGEAMLLASVTYAHPIYRSRNAEVADPRPPGAFACVGGTSCQDLASGTMNPSDTLSYLFLAEFEWGKWSPAVMYLGASQWAYRPPDATNPVDGTPIERPPGFEPTTVRQTHYVSAWLDYNFNAWFTGEVGFWNSVNAIDGGGRRSNVLFERYQDTRVYLGCSIQLDNLVKALQGGGEGEAGVVRARNTRQPLWTF